MKVIEALYISSQNFMFHLLIDDCKHLLKSLNRCRFVLLGDLRMGQRIY